MECKWETSLAHSLSLRLKSHSCASILGTAHQCPHSGSAARLFAFVFFSCSLSHALPFSSITAFFPHCCLLPRLGIKGFQVLCLLFSPFRDTPVSDRSRPASEIAE
uniref:Uncharacterized protein n=1 Tax=Mus musculus TaxID=10090 RepID=Q3URT7_MOUSE|nr:unnamed protein product [Mus musculus]